MTNIRKLVDERYPEQWWRLIAKHRGEDFEEIRRWQCWVMFKKRNHEQMVEADRLRQKKINCRRRT